MFGLLRLTSKPQPKLGRSNPDGPTKLRKTDFKIVDHHHGKCKVRVLRVRQVRHPSELPIHPSPPGGLAALQSNTPHPPIERPAPHPACAGETEGLVALRARPERGAGRQQLVSSMATPDPPINPLCQIGGTCFSSI
eukprot:scaffold57994_cov35-Tisochrysis_lutea.AAC.5